MHQYHSDNHRKGNARNQQAAPERPRGSGQTNPDAENRIRIGQSAGKFEDSIKNGSSLNSIVNAILLEVAKLNPYGWQVGASEDKTLDVASEPIETIVKQEQNPKVDVPPVTEEETDDSDEKISFEGEDFMIEEE